MTTTTPAFRAQEELDNIREYLEDRQDASMEPGEDRFHGNKEMSLLQDLEKVENSIQALCSAISDETIDKALLDWLDNSVRADPAYEVEVAAWIGGDGNTYLRINGGDMFGGNSLRSALQAAMPLPEAPK